MASKLHDRIFRKGSKTYYFSSFFFPGAVKRDVYILYAFVRVADNLVDTEEGSLQAFLEFKQRYHDALERNTASGDSVIDLFIDLMHRKRFDPAWVDAFLYSMEYDTGDEICSSLDDTLRYIYGSAEVIGLFMARIMDLDERSYQAARMLGRAMQYINFIRDIDEDNGLKRRYIPLVDTPLTSLSRQEAYEQPEAFKAFMRREISRYHTWQKEAEKGYSWIPRRLRIPIMTAADMYCWTSSVIYRDPFIVFERKVKPSKRRILRKGLARTIGVAASCYSLSK